MAAPLYRLGRFCVRRRWLVVLAWIATAAALAALASSRGGETSDDLTLPGTGSQRATELLETRFPEQANGTNPVVMEAPAGAKLTDERYADAIDATVESLERQPEVAEAVSPLSSEGRAFLSEDERIGYISLTLEPSASELTEENAEAVIAAQQPARDAGLEVANGGYLGQEVSRPSTHDSEVVGMAAAIVILTLTFGTLVAMGLPIITAIFGLSAGLSIVALLGQVTDVPTVAPTLATMIGLGVGIDYALFIVTRHMTQVRDAMELRESIARATATSGGAVAFAGGTVIVALLSLIAAGIPLVSTLGYTAALAVAIAVIAALTLLPAVLAIVGARIHSLRVPLPRPREHAGRRWERWARFVVRHPLPAIVVSVGILAVLAWPARDLHLGQSDTSALPTETESRRSYDMLAEGFGPGTAGPLLVAVELAEPAVPDADKRADLERDHEQEQRKQEEKIETEAQTLVLQGVPPDQAKEEATAAVVDEDEQRKAERSYERQLEFLESTASDPRLVELQETLEEEQGVESVTPPLVNDDGRAAVYTVVPEAAPWDRATEELVERLRESTLPAATKGQDMSADVGGRTAGFIDLADRISSKLPRVIAIVIVLAFVILMLAFRSVAIPLKAGLMNLVSIGAAFGVVTAVFQQGHGIEAVGLSEPVPIVSFVPLMMFAILFGLSMDYEVFLMSHMQERYRRRADNAAAVVDGLAGTARLITSAALIMVFVFGSFVLNGDPTVKQFGVGMSVAIAVDATIVRCLLVPGMMALMGSANWWMPKPLDRVLPRISVEGDEYFAKASSGGKE